MAFVKGGEQEVKTLAFPADAPARGAFGLRAVGGAAEFMNLYVRDLAARN